MCQPFSIVAVTTPRPLESTVPLNLTRSCGGGVKTESICARREIVRKNEASTLLRSGHPLLELREDDVDVRDVLRFREGHFERSELFHRALIIALLHVDVAGEQPRLLVRLPFALHSSKFADGLQAFVEALVHRLRDGELVVSTVANLRGHARLSGQLSQSRL